MHSIFVPLAPGRVVFLFFLVVTVASCGRGEGGQQLPPVTGGDGSLPDRFDFDTVDDDASDAGDADAGAGEAVSSTVVTVVIHSPAAGSVHLARQTFAPWAEVQVITAAGNPEDPPQRVTAQVDGMPDTVLNVVRVTRSAPGTTVYRYEDTPVDLSKLETGDHTLTVEAQTVSGAMAATTVMLKVDAGPRIVIRSPKQGAAYRSSAIIDVEVWSAADPLFGLDKVSMSVGAGPVAFTAPPPGGSTYGGLLDFNSFQPPLDGEQLFQVRATNKNGTEARATATFLVDNVGPTIANTRPERGALIGGIILIEAEITDPAGVAANTAVAIIGHESGKFVVPLDPPDPARGTATFHGLFDTRLLPINDIFPSLSFRVSDLLGNESFLGYKLGVDNTPPLSDLDPPTLFRASRIKDGVLQCSHLFDPVGSDAANDRQKVAQVFDVRARIEDQGNRPVSGPIDFSPIAPVSATLLVLDDVTRALAVDTDGDGICDGMNPLLVPTTVPLSSREVLALELVPVPVRGRADFTYDASLPGVFTMCNPGDDPDVPNPLCHTTDIPIAIPHISVKVPAIWSLAPVLDDNVQCVGRQFDAYANNIRDGWACFAVLASDEIGNSQISRILRLCIDHDGVGGECASLASPPDCTGTITALGPPPTVDATRPCTPWLLYPPLQVRRID